MATIYDIAKASGVSATTVSHVLNRTRYVSPEVTSRVMDAVEDLGYEPLRQRKKSNDMSQVKRGCMGLIIDRQLLTVCGCRSYVRMSGRYEWITISVDGTLTEKQLLRYMKQYHLNRVLGSSISGVPVRRAANQTCGAGEHTTAESAYITRKNGSTTLDIGL